MTETVKVKFYCGMYRGPAKWKLGSDWYKEPDECCNEGVIEVDAVEWDEEYVSHICSSCGNELHQCDDHFELFEVTHDPIHP
ncbi:hypothetical protein A8709_32865 [Paenibacillus pectinilyticus]|uniref:Uncharacterized protein n=1 Tax=Paenibacillus pectinilyticus TaxID=512399 RepID=A0A1C0ZWX8_9BACL|nr:hypothetical protein A8709_32865 [Paenibacillus pectinilyticus]